MDQANNYTPLNSEKISPRKKKLNPPNKLLIGLVLLFAVAVGVVGFLLTKSSIRTNVPATTTQALTGTPTPAFPVTSPVTSGTIQTVTTSPFPTVPQDTATPTPNNISASPSGSPTPAAQQSAVATATGISPTATPIPVACGTKACDSSNNPCRSGLVCIQANDGSNYCTLPEFQTACRQNPTQASCCTNAGQSPTPSEILLAQASITPGQNITITANPTAEAKVTAIPSAGVATYGIFFGVTALGIILLGLFL